MIYIKLLTINQKKQKAGGSFYAIALGIGILVSTVSSLVMNAISASRPADQQTTNYGMRRTTIMRLSPVPTRSTLSIIG